MHCLGWSSKGKKCVGLDPSLRGGGHHVASLHSYLLTGIASRFVCPSLFYACFFKAYESCITRKSITECMAKFYALTEDGVLPVVFIDLLFTAFHLSATLPSNRYGMYVYRWPGFMLLVKL